MTDQEAEQSPSHAQGTSRGRIIRDDGPASSGGASRTQRVLVKRSDGTEYKAHAKFARDRAGAIIAEGGEQGLAAELLASRLGSALSAPVPRAEVVDVPADIDIRLRDDRRPSPDLPAVALETIEPWVDANAAEALDGTSHADLAHIAALHGLVEAQDRSHNMIRSGDRAYAVDHATALSSAWSGTEGRGVLLADDIALKATMPAAMKAAGEALAALSDESIDDAVDDLPRELVPSDDVRQRLKANLKTNRSTVVNQIKKEYDSKA